MIPSIEAPTPSVVRVSSNVPVSWSLDFNEPGAGLNVQSDLQAEVSSTSFGKVIVKAVSADLPGRYGKIEIDFLIPLSATVL